MGFPPNALMIKSIEGRKAEVVYQAKTDFNKTFQTTGYIYFSPLEEAINDYKKGSLIDVESVLLNSEKHDFRTDPAIVAAAKGNGPGIIPKDFSQISKGTIVTGVQAVKGLVKFLDGMCGRIPKAQSASADFGAVISCEVADFDVAAKFINLLP